MLDNEKIRRAELLTSEMRFLGSVNGCTRLNQIRNEDIREE
jgi:hypothetical protein